MNKNTPFSQIVAQYNAYRADLQAAIKNHDEYRARLIQHQINILANVAKRPISSTHR